MSPVLRTATLAGRAGGMSGRSWARAGVGGRVVHAVEGGDFGKALCGAQPGRRSAGWADTAAPVTCPKCQSKTTP